MNVCLSAGFHYAPTSNVFINVPGVSSLQWHPFTVCSSSNLEPERLSVIIKKEGSWTRKLYQMLSLPNLDHLDVSVEGPYGPPSIDFLRYVLTYVLLQLLLLLSYWEKVCAWLLFVYVLSEDFDRIIKFLLSKLERWRWLLWFTKQVPEIYDLVIC